MKNKVFWLALCILLACLTACNGNEPLVPDEGMKGEKFYFRGSFIAAAPRDNPDADEASAEKPYIETSEGEAMFDHCLLVEKKLNCVIVRYEEAYTSVPTFAASFAAGKTPTDILSAVLVELYDLYKSDVLADLNTISAIDASDEAKWGSLQRREATTYHGAAYAFPLRGSTYYPFVMKYNGALIYNVDLFNSYVVGTTPQEMIENGLWTFDGFEALAKQVCAAELDKPKYALALINSLPTAAAYANGGDAIVKNKKGQYSFGYTSDKVLHAFEWARRLSMTDGIIAANGFGDFEAGNATFALVPSDVAISSTIPEVSWVNFPYGPDVEYGTTSTAYFGYHERGIAIMKHVDNPERDELVGQVFDALFEPTEKFGEDGYDEYMIRNFFRSREDYEVYKSLGLDMHYDWSKELNRDTKISTLLQTAVANALEEPTSSVGHEMDAIANVINNKVCKEMNGG